MMLELTLYCFALSGLALLSLALTGRVARSWLYVQYQLVPYQQENSTHVRSNRG